MCRDDNDCNWIDARLYCQDYELDFQPSVSKQSFHFSKSDIQELKSLANFNYAVIRYFNGLNRGAEIEKSTKITGQKCPPR